MADTEKVEGMKKSHKFGWIAIALAVVLFATPITLELNKTTHSDPEPFVPIGDSTILGPSEAAIGELVRLKAPGDDVEWTCLPETEDYQKFGENNQNMVVSFRKRGRYTIIAATVESGDLRISKLKIDVGKVVVPEVDDEEGVPVVEVDDIMAKDVQSWCETSKIDTGIAESLGKNFETIADLISRGELTTVDAVVSATAQYNQELKLPEDFADLMGNIQNLLTELSDSGKLKDAASHEGPWRSIAEGLRGYAQ